MIFSNADGPGTLSWLHLSHLRSLSQLQKIETSIQAACHDVFGVLRRGQLATLLQFSFRSGVYRGILLTFVLISLLELSHGVPT